RNSVSRPRHRFGKRSFQSGVPKQEFGNEVLAFRLLSSFPNSCLGTPGPKLCFAAAASIRDTEFPKRRSQTGVWERGFGLSSFPNSCLGTPGPKLCFAAAASIRETEFPKRRSQTGVWERGFGLRSALG